jgi:hypothetical protein
MSTHIPPQVAAIAPDGNLTPRQRRRLMLDLSLRRQKPGTGSSVEFMLRRTAMNVWPDFREPLNGIRWIVIGGVATRAYMPERATKDLDILVRAEDGPEVIERLKKIGYKVLSRLAVPGFLLRSPEGLEVDVLFGKYRWLDEALAQPTTDPAGLPVLQLPYLVLMKMAANRGRDVGDLTTMLGWASDADLAEVRRVAAQYTPDEVGDLETLIFIGQRERETPPDAELPASSEL